MEDNNKIFLDFWKEFKWPDPEPLYFRVYHDDQGNILRYSRHDEPGNFIETTPLEFSLGRMDLKIRDGRLIYPPPPRPPKLTPSSHGIACHADDVTVIADAGCQQIKLWEMKNNE